MSGPVEAVLASVARKHGITPEIVRRSREPSAVRARREWVGLVRDSWGLSIAETARLCGVQRDIVRSASSERAPTEEARST